MAMDEILTNLTNQTAPIVVIMGIILIALWKAFLDQNKATIAALNANSTALTQLSTKIDALGRH